MLVLKSMLNFFCMNVATSGVTRHDSFKLTVSNLNIWPKTFFNSVLSSSTFCILLNLLVEVFVV